MDVYQRGYEVICSIVVPWPQRPARMQASNTATPFQVYHNKGYRAAALCGMVWRAGTESRTAMLVTQQSDVAILDHPVGSWKNCQEC